MERNDVVKIIVPGAQNIFEYVQDGIDQAILNEEVTIIIETLQRNNIIGSIEETIDVEIFCPKNSDTPNLAGVGDEMYKIVWHNIETN